MRFIKAISLWALVTVMAVAADAKREVPILPTVRFQPGTGKITLFLHNSCATPYAVHMNALKRKNVEFWGCPCQKPAEEAEPEEEEEGAAPEDEFIISDEDLRPPEAKWRRAGYIAPEELYFVVLKPGEFVGAQDDIWHLRTWGELQEKAARWGDYNLYLTMDEIPTISIFLRHICEEPIDSWWRGKSRNDPQSHYRPWELMTAQIPEGVRGFTVKAADLPAIKTLATAAQKAEATARATWLKAHDNIPPNDAVPGRLRGRIVPYLDFDPQTGEVRFMTQNVSYDWAKIHMRSIERLAAPAIFLTAAAPEKAEKESVKLCPPVPKIVPRKYVAAPEGQIKLWGCQVKYPDNDHLTVVLKRNEFIGFSVKIWELSNWEKLVAQVEKDGARVLRLNQTIYGADEKDLPVADFAVRDGRETDLADQGADVARAENPTINRAEFPTSFTLDAPTVKKMRELAKLAKKMTK